MKRALKIILPVTVLAGALLIAWFILNAQPKAESRRPPPAITRVEFLPAAKVDFQITLHSQGTVQARTESVLASEVSGKIISVAPKFRAGGFFKEGDILLRIDPSDYETAVVVAEAALAKANLRLFEEQARSDQAFRDWERIGSNELPSTLALRDPQLAEAAAANRAAEARLVQARGDLEDTSIRAPFAGRVLEHRVDLGEYINANTVLARIYSVDFAEVRLPLSERQLDHIELPELYRGDQVVNVAGPTVVLQGGLGQTQFEWDGRIVRTEGAVDQRSRQLFVVAEVADPYGRLVPGRPPLKVGMFVRAKIQGNTLNDVFVLPRRALREDRLLMIANPEDQLERREIDIVWRDQDRIVVRDGIRPGERIITTQLSYAVEGMRISTGGGKRGMGQQRMLERFDTDGDGDLSPAERETARTAIEAEGGPGGRGGMTRQKMLKRFDTDGDGVISDAEREAARATRQQTEGKP
jgi:multidrug efflux system membrane fusion protein